MKPCRKKNCRKINSRYSENIGGTHNLDNNRYLETLTLVTQSVHTFGKWRVCAIVVIFLIYQGHVMWSSLKVRTFLVSSNDSGFNYGGAVTLLVFSKIESTTCLPHASSLLLCHTNSSSWETGLSGCPGVTASYIRFDH